MSTENFIDSLGVESSEVIDATTLLQDYNPGADVDLEKLDEPAPAASKKVEKEDDDVDPVKALKDEPFLKDQDTIEDLLNTYETDEEEDEPASKTPTPKKNEPKVETEEDGETNFFELFGKNLTKLGVFSPDEEEEADEEFEWNEDTFVTKFEDNARKLANEYIEQAFSKFGPQHREFLMKVAQEGVDPKAYFEALESQNFIEQYDIENEPNQERIVFEYMRMLEPDRDPSEIAEEISDLKDLNKLEKKAEQAKVKLTNYYAQKQAELERQAVEQQQQQEYNRQQFTKTIEENIKQAISVGQIDNIPFDKRDEQELVKYITETPYQTRDGRPVTSLYKDFVQAQQNPDSLLKLAKFLKSGLKVDSAIKKAVKEETKKMWDFGVTKKKRTLTPGKKNGFLD
jgi:hypothetical protein